MTPTREQIAEASRWHIRLQDEAASDAEWNAFSDWLEEDPAHRHAYDRVEEAWIVMGSTPEPVAVPEIVAANDEVVLRGPEARRRRRPAWLVPGVAAAAAAVLTIGLWPSLSGQGGLQTYQTTTAPMTVALKDGTHIYLNRDTDLTVRMGRDRRSVTLGDGEAAFDVTHDPSKPFEIRAGARSVRVLGTAFNVLNHEDRFAVGVERGVVAVTPAGGSPTVRLVAGQSVAQTGTGPATTRRVNPGQISGWRRGVLVYEDRPLSEVAADISRYTVHPLLVTPDAGAVRFTGTLRLGDEAAMIGQLTSFLPVERDTTSPELRLRKRATH